MKDEEDKKKLSELFLFKLSTQKSFFSVLSSGRRKEEKLILNRCRNGLFKRLLSI
jgi:hypothetical protein